MIPDPAGRRDAGHGSMPAIMWVRLLLGRSPLLPVAPDLVGFRHAQVAECAMGAAVERTLIAAISGTGLPVAILGPVTGFLAVVQDTVKEFAAVLGRAHFAVLEALSELPQLARNTVNK